MRRSSPPGFVPSRILFASSILASAFALMEATTPNRTSQPASATVSVDAASARFWSSPIPSVIRPDEVCPGGGWIGAGVGAEASTVS